MIAWTECLIPFRDTRREKKRMENYANTHASYITKDWQTRFNSKIGFVSNGGKYKQKRTTSFFQLNNRLREKRWNNYPNNNNNNNGMQQNKRTKCEKKLIVDENDK